MFLIKVSQLHTELEQQRSKLHAAKMELTKLQVCCTYLIMYVHVFIQIVISTIIILISFSKMEEEECQQRGEVVEQFHFGMARGSGGVIL